MVNIITEYILRIEGGGRIYLELELITRHRVSLSKVSNLSTLTPFVNHHHQTKIHLKFSRIYYVFQKNRAN